MGQDYDSSRIGFERVLATSDDGPSERGGTDRCCPVASARQRVEGDGDRAGNRCAVRGCSGGPVTEHTPVPLRELAPGAGVLVVLAGIALSLSAVVPRANELLVAIALGALVANVLGVPDWLEPGTGLYKLPLEVGIVLLGAQLVADELLAAGPTVLLLVAGTVAFGLLYAEVLARFAFRFGRDTGTLLAAGSSVCGVSAIVAVAGTIQARGNAIAYAVGTILVFDAVTLVVFPIVGNVLGLSGQAFGIWAGLSMFSTGPVVAAGFAHSTAAGEWATVTKLARNSLLGVVVVAYSLVYARSRADGPSQSITRTAWDGLPKFVIGFAAVAALATAGVIPDEGIESIARLSELCFVVAFAGLGLSIRVSSLRSTGIAPLALVTVYLLTVGLLTLVAVTVLF